MPRELYYNDGAVTREICTDSSSDEFAVRTAQDMEQVTDLVKDLREIHHTVGHRKSRCMVPVAEIPMLVIEKAMHEGWFNDPVAWRRWANDPENAPFRITKGRL